MIQDLTSDWLVACILLIGVTVPAAVVAMLISQFSLPREFHDELAAFGGSKKDFLWGGFVASFWQCWTMMGVAFPMWKGFASIGIKLGLHEALSMILVMPLVLLTIPVIAGFLAFNTPKYGGQARQWMRSQSLLYQPDKPRTDTRFILWLLDGIPGARMEFPRQ